MAYIKAFKLENHNMSDGLYIVKEDKLYLLSEVLVHNYNEKIIFPCENNGKNLDCKFCDTDKTFNQLLQNITERQESISENFWIINDSVTINAIKNTLDDKKLYIISGQEKYDNALENKTDFIQMKISGDL